MELPCNLLWMEEILHQLIDGLSYYLWVSTIQGGAGFRNHPQHEENPPQTIHRSHCLQRCIKSSGSHGKSSPEKTQVFWCNVGSCPMAAWKSKSKFKNLAHLWF